MRRILGSLTVTGSVCVLVTSALVFAQVPTSAPPAPPSSQKDSRRDVQVEKVEKQAGVPKQAARAKALVVRKAIVMGGANLENQIQQFMRQGRPSVRAELIFVRKICQLNVEQLRRINHDAETSLKEAVTKFAEAQQQGRMPRVQGKGQSAPMSDPAKFLGDQLAAVMKKNLTPDQFGRYQAERDKRDANRKQAAIRYLVDALDRDLYLSEQQRDTLTESISSHWDDNWCMSLEYVLYGNQFYPIGLDPYVTPFLDDMQKKVWQGTQKVGTFWGFGGVWGNFINDTDALEEELGEVKKADPAINASMPAIEMLRDQMQMQMRKVQTKKSIAKEAATKK